jgi:hypothetical protein
MHIEYLYIIMKIGILTLPLHYNYGGILQAYALQTVLQRIGHEVEVIDKDFSAHLPWYKKPISYFKRIVKKYLFHKNCCVFLEQKTNYERSLFCKNTSVFVHKYVNTRKIKTLKEIKQNKLGLARSAVWDIGRHWNS